MTYVFGVKDPENSLSLDQNTDIADDFTVVVVKALESYGLYRSFEDVERIRIQGFSNRPLSKPQLSSS